MNEFARRRAELLAAMGDDGVAVIPSAGIFARNADVEHEFRQDSDLFYLTGFSEPDAVLVLRAADSERDSTLFVRARDPEREIWDGPREGVEGAVNNFGVRAAHPIGEFADRLADLLSGRRRLYYALGRDRARDDAVIAAISKIRARARKGVVHPSEIVEPGVVLHEMRWRKSDHERLLMQRAAEITARGFDRAFEFARPGVFEYEIDARMRAEFRIAGSPRPAYPPIVASGPNACVLHYVSNDRRMNAGDLLLIDAGAEFGGYASDVTRTFPVAGAFTPEQQRIYELVLRAQLAAIDLVRPGATIEKVHAAAVKTISEGLVALGLLSQSVDEVISSESYKRFFMHGTSHWLGMDVHDAGRYYVDGASRPFESGCVITVEPGLYFSTNDEGIAPEYRGIGVRIEDDVWVTSTAHEVLTAMIPKSIVALEARIASARAA